MVDWYVIVWMLGDSRERCVSGEEEGKARWLGEERHRLREEIVNFLEKVTKSVIVNKQGFVVELNIVH